MQNLKIALASDHAGFSTKLKVKEFLLNSGYQVHDFGCNSEESCDYPDFAHPLAYSVDNKEFNIGIVFCGSGNGINMTVNKHPGIRSAIAWNKEIAEMARLHNNANVLSIPARYVSASDVIEIVKIFLSTGFEGGRHQNRIDKIPL